MEKEFAEKISEHTGIPYFKIYILLYEYIRYLWCRSLAGLTGFFSSVFKVMPYNEIGYAKCINNHIRKAEYDILYDMAIDAAFARACFLKDVKHYKGNSRKVGYKTITPFLTDKNIYWRNDIVTAESQILSKIYRKLKIAIYKRVDLNTKLEVEFYEYCKYTYDLMVSEKLIKLQKPAYLGFVRGFKLKVNIKL